MQVNTFKEKDITEGNEKTEGDGGRRRNEGGGDGANCWANSTVSNLRASMIGEIVPESGSGRTRKKGEDTTRYCN